MKENGDSYKDISAQLIKMRKMYKCLTEEQRNSESGKELLKKIEEDRQTLISMEAEIGIFHCNVNEYTKTNK